MEFTCFECGTKAIVVGENDNNLESEVKFLKEVIKKRHKEIERLASQFNELQEEVELFRKHAKDIE